MTAVVPTDLIAELEAVVKDGSSERRQRLLLRVSDFLFSTIDRLAPQQISVFDEVLVRLVDRVEARDLAELGAALADLPAAPRETIRRLAWHENPSVAAPILAKSHELSEEDLRVVAGNRSQRHLLAIAQRQALTEGLTDLILKHAGRDTIRALVKNPSASFSGQGFTILLAVAGRDEFVAEALGLRPDLPVENLPALLSKTTQTVRARLLKAAPPELRERIQSGLDDIAPRAEASPPSPSDYSDAHSAVAALSRIGKLNDSTVNRFAIRREYSNVVAALSLLSGAGIETLLPLMDDSGGEGLIIACRASRLNWQTTLAVINNRRVPPLSRQQLEQAKQMFEMLFVSTAQYTIRFEPPLRSAADQGSDNRDVAGARA
jgi:uncharacterized protein (DUF2336 family)